MVHPPEVGGRHRVSAGDGEGRTAADSTMDFVIKSALERGIITAADLARPSTEGGYAVDWRAICTSMPEHADSLRRLAAGLYGFQPVVVSLVGTLVLADRLKHRLSAEVWRQCYRLDCIPVAPHGASPSSTDRLTLASPDPARGAVRNLVRSSISGEATLTYADRAVVGELKSFLRAELPFLRAALDEPAASQSNAA